MKMLIAVTLCSCIMALSPLTSSANDHASTETLGSVAFSTSCSPPVQPQFNRAVALMHSFQFGAAIQAFHSVLEADPKCAIAEWGIALSSWGNPFAGFKTPAQVKQGLLAVEEGRAIATGTERERAYLDAVAHLYTDSTHIDQPTRLLAYEHAMATVSATYPDDIEATIFYALALAASADPTDKTYTKQLKAGALLENLFAKYPNHPGLAHYIIHAYDEPALAARAAEAARRYGEIAPSTPHALHMPSHTFTRIGDWQSSIDTNTSSAAAARAAHQPADVLHASDYMVYAYLQTAQDEAAKRLVELSAQTFLTFDPAYVTGAAPASAAYFAHAAIPARYCLERQAWADAVRLEPLPSPFPYADAITYFTQGLGAAHLNNEIVLQQAIQSLKQLQVKLAQMKEDYWANQIDIQRQELAAMLSFVQGHQADALAGMHLAVELEDKTETASVTPGPLKPAREMLGELLLQLKQPSEALKEFQAALKREPNRFWSLYGAAEAAKQAGDREKTSLYFQELLTVAKRADQPGRPELAEARAAIQRD
jgi:tetratricopeptide (TPR) repeat protein